MPFNVISTLTAEFRNIALFGANCPAGTLSAPAGWVQVVMPDGRLGYIPIWA